MPCYLQLCSIPKVVARLGVLHLLQRVEVWSWVGAVQLQGLSGPCVAALEGVVAGVIEAEVVGELSTHHDLLHKGVGAGRVFAVSLRGQHATLR